MSKFGGSIWGERPKNIIKDIPKYKVICICKTELEVEEHSIKECPNCHKRINYKGVIQL